MKAKLAFAKMDPALCLAPGIFRTLKRGDRKQEKLDISFKFGEATVRFVGFEPLGVVDLRVLQALVALAGAEGWVTRADTNSPLGMELRAKINLAGSAVVETALVIKTHFKHLAREIQGSVVGGTQLKPIKASLCRLSNITVAVEVGQRLGTAHLLSFKIDESSGELDIILNPRLSGIILGTTGYTRIEMEEIRQLKSDVASLIHQRLCTFVKPGSHSVDVGIDKLISYAYPEEASSAEALRKRRQRVKLAITEIDRLTSWEIKVIPSGLYHTTRRKLAAADASAVEGQAV